MEIFERRAVTSEWNATAGFGIGTEPKPDAEDAESEARLKRSHERGV